MLVKDVPLNEVFINDEVLFGVVVVVDEMLLPYMLDQEVLLAEVLVAT